LTLLLAITVPSVWEGINLLDFLLHEKCVELSLIEIFPHPKGLVREALVKMDGSLIESIDFKIKCLNSEGIAKINIELHQFSAETLLSIMRVHTNIHKFRFFCHIPKTDKTDDRRF
jgi:hypothetical protein